MTTTGYRHWLVEQDLDGVCWLTLNRLGESSNSLSREVLSELSAIVSMLQANPPTGVVLQSGKPGSFILGADVREFDAVSDPVAAAESIREVHDLFDHIEFLPFPVAVTIEGFCLGGGLELALACHYRIAKNTETSRLGFPEIRLGIYPGFGGSARVTQRLGGAKGMELMLTGRMVSAAEAKAIGLVDQLVGRHEELRWAARTAVLQGRISRPTGLIARLTNQGPVRKFLADKMRKQTAARVNPNHYPAPFSLIEAWEQHGDSSNQMKAEEAVRVGQLITSAASQGLRRVFSLTERLKTDGKRSSFRARRVHVVGAGVMGGDIAAWCVLQGLEVTLQDRDIKYVQPALERAEKLFRRKLKTPSRIAGANSRLIADVEGQGVARADVVIEAIFENLEAKQALFRQLEPRLKPNAILATNTSAIPLADIARVLENPQRLIGLHFFNPVAKMPLVEVIYEPSTEAAAIDKAAAFCGQINRFPLPIRSSPGFLVNRVLAAYMQKALQIHRERGLPKEALDQAAVDFGMPMGPVELADTVGLDVGLSVMKLLGGAGASEDIATLSALVEQGKLGKKSGEGFYRWKHGRAVKNKEASMGINLKTLTDELMQPYFDECRACLADGIVSDQDMLDAGMVFGTGFAPFRGGPLYYLEQRSAAHLDAQPAAANPENSHDQ